MRKETLGMVFDLFSSRILSLSNHEHLNKRKTAQKAITKQITSCARWNENDICSKNYIARLKHNRFHFADGDLSLPVGHPYYQKLRHCNKNSEKQLKNF